MTERYKIRTAKARYWVLGSEIGWPASMSFLSIATKAIKGIKKQITFL